MRTLALILLLLAPLVSRGADRAQASNGTLDGHAAFYDLSKTEATEKAKVMALADFEQGRYRILVFGLRRTESPREIQLKERYGVATTAIAGCVVSPGIVAAAEGYNSTMKPLLNRKFGRDIFEETAGPATKR